MALKSVWGLGSRGAWLTAMLSLAACSTTGPAPVDERSITTYDPAPAPAAQIDEPVAMTPPAHAEPQSYAMHIVAPGETLYGIAFANRIDARTLAVWNEIPPPYTIYPGQRLRMEPPPAREVAVEPAATVPQTTIAPSFEAPRPVDNSHPVQTTDEGTETFAVSDTAAPRADERALAVESLPPGNTAPTPGATTQSTPSPVATPSAPTVATPSAPTVARPAPSGAVSAAISGQHAPVASSAPRPAPAANPPPATVASAASTPAPATAPSAPPATTTAPPPNKPVMLAAAPARNVGGVNWRWPAPGSVIQRFVAGDGARSGVDIQGASGQPVAAAADGEVVYSGNGLLGYGELIIIKHSASFLSAYGHNRKRLVGEGERVKAGQQIAEMGANGTALNLLHFEIRQDGRPVDPLRFLPPR